MKAVCKPRVFLQLLDCSAAQAVTFETTTSHHKGTSPTMGDARPVYMTVDQFDSRSSFILFYLEDAFRPGFPTLCIINNSMLFRVPNLDYVLYMFLRKLHF